MESYRYFIILKRHRWELEQREPYAGELEGVMRMITYQFDRERMDREKEQQKSEAASRKRQP
jgi:hypothetical protein